MADDSYLRIHGLNKTYPGTRKPAVAGIDLSLAQGELLALLGPSGCGKTTTLRMIAGLVEPTAGRIEVAGRDVTRVPVHKRGMGMVFQSFALFPHLDVAENVAFGLRLRRIGSAERRRRVAEVLERVELSDFARRRVAQLSGGQQQRVALARALVVDPTLLLLDEPLSALDAKLRESLRTQIREIQQASGTTSVFVTHDQDEALSMADKVAVMHEGAVVQFGPPEEIYQAPATVFAATFIGRANLFTGTLGQDGVLDADGLGRIPVAPTTVAPGKVSAMLRPQLVHVREGADTPQDGAFPGTVVSTSYTGDLISYRIDVSGRTVDAERSSAGATILAPGTPVEVSWDAADVRVLEG
ncbi:ABC transporter ATP-binding protein [Nonomuraea sp. NPDC046802]|uniref:ABC transporter ATP-binding protein n=1 Tax=Nonomuraea sp. NPDC046802 TaxID=3154919 RepID=UPI0033C546DB